mgnify:CR=1 FL=1
MPKQTEEEDAALKQGINEKTGQVSKEVKELVFKFEEPLWYLQRASEQEPCDWQLDLPAGPELTLSHLQKTCDCVASPLIISYIIGMTIERSATEVLLDNCEELDADQRSGLLVSIKELPEENSVDAPIG